MWELSQQWTFILQYGDKNVDVSHPHILWKTWIIEAQELESGRWHSFSKILIFPWVLCRNPWWYRPTVPSKSDLVWWSGYGHFGGFHVKFQGCIFKPQKNSEEKSRVLKAQHLSGRSCCEKRGRNRNFSRRWSSTRSVTLSIGHWLGESWLVSPRGYPDPVHV